MPFTDQEVTDQAVAAKAAADQLAADQTAQAAAAAAPANDHTSVFLVAGDRAFKDPESVVKNIENAQSHISTLEAERKTDGEKLDAANVEIARLKKIEDGLDGRTDTGKSDQTDQMSNEQLAAHAASLAVGLIEQNSTAEVQKTNLAQAEAAAELAYGKETYVSKISEIAKSLGMTLAAVDALGQSSPDAFKRLFLPTDPGQPHQPTRTTVNAPAGTGQSTDQRPVNIVKMREKDRMSTVAEKMKAAGVDGY